ncbi:class I SAM-dependent methyltransferase [bacterium]|nr:class I SAM-dependent methyltransferase [bacterium]
MLMEWLRQLADGQDTFTRHLCVQKLLATLDAKTVLDVGGEGRLVPFIGKDRVTTANIRQQRGVDQVLNSLDLPYRDDSFDAAVSIDTLEHIPEPARVHFIEEMRRVSSKGLVICAPLGTVEHCRYEQGILDEGRLAEEGARYLREHVAHGLPTPEDVFQWADRFKGMVMFQGDFRRCGARIKTRFVSLLLNLFGNIWQCVRSNLGMILRAEHGPYTNRFFLVVLKNTAVDAGHKTRGHCSTEAPCR